MLLNDFVHKYILQNKTTSNIENDQTISSLYLIDIEIYLRDALFSSDTVIVNLHPSKGTLWVAYKNEKQF